MMKRSIAVLVLLVGTAHARPRPADSTMSDFEANKTFGLGLELGEPFGINGKYFYSRNKAIDFGLGDIYDYYNYRGVYLYADHLWHPTTLVRTEAFELPFYIGAGASIWHWEDYRGAVVDGDAIGARMPIGVSFDFNNTPLDIFVQLVPTLDLFADTPMGYDRNYYFIIEGSVGLRYWFK
jgi:hypothetical protein